MLIVADCRPSQELSDAEVVAYLFKAVRAQGMRRAAQVQAELQRLFPDLPGARQQRCLRQLADALA